MTSLCVEEVRPCTDGKLRPLKRNNQILIYFVFVILFAFVSARLYCIVSRGYSDLIRYAYTFNTVLLYFLVGGPMCATFVFKVFYDYTCFFVLYRFIIGFGQQFVQLEGQLP